jgi:glycosyltransferase involved in cell wall biosynthesis
LYPLSPKKVSEQPRLLFCCFDVVPAPTGLSRRVTEYLKGLSDRFQVVVLSTKTPDHTHIERYQGARLLRVPVGSGDLQSRIQAFDRAVRRQLESEEYVLTHFFDPFGGYALSDLRAQYGFRLVYDAQTFPSQELRHTHPSLEGDRRFLSKVRRQELFCLMNADVVICGSEVTRDYVLSLGAPPLSLHVYHQPVDLEPYTRAAMGQPDGSPMKLLHLGSQLNYQGLQTLLRAMQLALRQADMRLLVVGPKHPDYQGPLEELVAELKLFGKVEFQPPVPHDDLPKVLATVDVGVLPLDESDRNRQQGGPLAKVGEYLAAGRPVVASDLAVTRELIPESARVLFPPGDFKALADVLVRLAHNATERVSLGEQARIHSDRFDASAVRGRLLDLYANLATRGKVSPASDANGEITQLRASGSDTSKIRQRAAIIGPGEAGAERTDEIQAAKPADTLDDEPPVVVGEGLGTLKGDGERGQVITEPRAANPETPVVMGHPLREGPTPIQQSPDGQSEPTPITTRRPRRTGSRPRVVEPPGNWPEPLGTEKTDVANPQAEPEPPPKAKRPTAGKDLRPVGAPPSEGRGLRSPASGSHASVAGPPLSAPPSEGRGVRSPASGPHAPVVGPPLTAPPSEGRGLRSPASGPHPSPVGLPLGAPPSEGRGLRSPGSGPHASPMAPPAGVPPSQGRGLRSPVPGPHASPPPPSPGRAVMPSAPPASPPSRPSSSSHAARPVPLPPASPPVHHVSPLAPLPTALPPPPASPPQNRQSTTDPMSPPPPASPPGPRPANIAAPPASPPQPAKLPTPGASPPPPPAPLAGRGDLKPAPLPPPPARLRRGSGPHRALTLSGDEPVEISADEVESLDDVDDVGDVDDVQSMDGDEGPPPATAASVAARIDPWLSQLLFGYCPPEALPFERPPPPTAMPGKEPPPR